MSEKDKLHEVELRCNEILRSPYMFKELPGELQKLKSALRNVDLLVREDVPWLVAEIKRLRSENKRLNATPPPLVTSDSPTQTV